MKKRQNEMWEMDYEASARYWTDKEKDAVSMDSEDIEPSSDEYMKLPK